MLSVPLLQQFDDSKPIISSEYATLYAALSEAGLEKHFAVLEENEVTLDSFRTLDVADLKDIGLALGPRKALYALVKSLDSTPPATAEPQAPPVTSPTDGAGAGTSDSLNFTAQLAAERQHQQFMLQQQSMLAQSQQAQALLLSANRSGGTTGIPDGKKKCFRCQGSGKQTKIVRDCTYEIQKNGVVRFVSLLLPELNVV